MSGWVLPQWLREEIKKGRPDWKPFESKVDTEEVKWRSLFENPGEWRDYREAKKQGLVKATHRDFKRANSGVSLWLDSKATPEWVEEALVRGSWAQWGSAVGGASAQEARWLSLFDSPGEWIDYRAAKGRGASQTRFPDFKRVDGQGYLWISGVGTPKWVPERLAQGELDEKCSLGKVTANVVHKRVAKDVPKVLSTVELQWRSLFDSPEQWFDFRKAKKDGQVSAKFPDFKKSDGSALWVDPTLAWVVEELEKGNHERKLQKPEDRMTHWTHRTWRSLFDNPDEWLDWREAKAHGTVSSKLSPRDELRTRGTVKGCSLQRCSVSR